METQQQDKTENEEKSQEQKPVNQKGNSSKPYLFQPGVSGNPKGRPKGKTIKERVREYLEEHPEDMEQFVDYFVKKNRDLAWQMLEGRPQQDVVTDGKALPTPLLYALSNNNSDKEDSGVKQED